MPLINIVAQESESKYLAFLDDDDIWLDNKLERQINLLEKSDCKMSSTEGLFGQGVYDHLTFNVSNIFEKLSVAI